VGSGGDKKGGRGAEMGAEGKMSEDGRLEGPRSSSKQASEQAGKPHIASRQQ